MKRVLALTLALAFLLSSSIAAAHSGGTDRNGGHWNHKTGEYHYHNPPNPWNNN